MAGLGCIRPIQDFSKKHFLAVSIPIKNKLLLEQKLPKELLGHKANGQHVYKFLRPLSKEEAIWIDGLLTGLEADVWEYGEYGRDRRIQFLDEVLDYARKHPELIGEAGKTIFSDNCPKAFDEGCAIKVRLDENKRPFFEYCNTSGGGAGSLIKVKTAEMLFEAGKRYFPEDYVAFAEGFRLWDGDKDRLEEIRAKTWAAQRP